METGKNGLRHSLETLLSGGETARLECKSANGGFPKSFWETYSAFANMDGGTIVLGDARNARLFNIFSLVDVGERSGSGLCNIFHVWRATGNPTPTVFETFDPERIEFVLEMKPETVGESKEKSKEKTAQSKEKSKEKTAQSKEKILGILADNPFVTIAEMVSSTGLSVSGVEKGLRKLKSTGRIRRVGPDKGGRWEVIKASAP